MAIRRYRPYTGEAPGLTHKQVVDRVFLWLRYSNKHTIVFRERRASTLEQPDVIGFNMGFSTLVEVKVSRSDFLADKKKWFRRRPEDGMGYYRYFAAPIGMLKPDDLPDGWGLIEICGKTEDKRRTQLELRVTVAPKPCVKRALSKENSYLVSAIRRFEISMAVFVEPTESQPITVTDK